VLELFFEFLPVFRLLDLNQLTQDHLWVSAHPEWFFETSLDTLEVESSRIQSRAEQLPWCCCQTGKALHSDSSANSNISMADFQIPLVKFENVSHGYREAGEWRDVLRGVDLCVHEGEQMALVGQSGSGKSTLLHLMGGLDTPRSGHILFNGVDLAAMVEPKRTLWRRHHVGFIYQFFNLIPTLTVIENVLLPLELNGVSERTARADGLNLLKEVGLEDRAETYPDRLSGGEQQRVAIIRALIHQPQLVLADEPTGNLDAATGEQVLDLLDRLVRAKGHTLILVTHSSEVARRADRVVRLVGGKLAPDIPL
jgi:putative ABC transport system ATP-binding protein